MSLATIGSTLLGSFSPLKIRNFRIYLGGQTLSLVGTWLQMTAQSWVVWELSHSATALGLVQMLGTLPMLVLSPWAGVWADRLDRRRLLVATQAGAMVLAFMLAILTQTGLIQLWHVYVLSLCLGIITALDLPAQQAFLGDLSGRDEVRKAVNLNVTIIQVSRVLGPAFAGVIIATLGAATAFWLNGVSFMAVIVSLLAVRASQVRSASSNTSAGGQLWDAIKFIQTQPRIRDLIIFAAFMTFFGLSIILNILPAVADRVLHGDAGTLGWLMAASGAGALAGVVVVVPFAQALRRSGLVVGAASIWVGLWFLAFSLSTVLPISVVCLFMVSLGAPTVMTTANGLLQLMSPPNMRARLLSLFVMVSFGMQPIAALLVGSGADRFGVPVAIQINAVLLIAGAAFMLLRPQLRQWEVSLPRTTEAAEAV